MNYKGCKREIFYQMNRLDDVPQAKSDTVKYACSECRPVGHCKRAKANIFAPYVKRRRAKREKRDKHDDVFRKRFNLM